MDLKSEGLEPFLDSNPGTYAIVLKDNGKVYVGSAVNVLNRVGTHYWKLEKGIHPNSEIQNEFNKSPNSLKVVSKPTFTRSLAFKEEQRLVDLIKEKEPDKLLNMAVNDVRTCKGLLQSHELKAKRSEIYKGRILSLETRKKISESLMGHQVSDVTREKQKGAFTDEHRAKLSQARRDYLERQKDKE